MHPCSECGMQWTSELAALECRDFDRAEARRTHEWHRQHPTK